MEKLDQFQRQKYLNIETFRKSGEGMKTPVWFVQEGETLYVSTMASSGKVKRIRNNGKVNIAACKMNGKLTGSWVPAQARVIPGPEIEKQVDGMLNRKYGLMKKLIDNQRAKESTPVAILEIKIP
jgi:uncharacterized protein